MTDATTDTISELPSKKLTVVPLAAFVKFLEAEEAEHLTKQQNKIALTSEFNHKYEA